MRMNLLAFISVSCFAMMVQSLPFRDLCPIKTEPVKDFDVNKFQGTWYEVMRTPVSRKLRTKCHTENYTLTESNKMNISATFVCKKSGEVQNTIGMAIVDPANPGNWNYSFPEVYAEGKLAVIDTDYTSYAVMFSCKTFEAYKDEYGWALSRERPPSEEVIKKLKEVYKRLGGDPKELQFVDQKKC